MCSLRLSVRGVYINECLYCVRVRVWELWYRGDANASFWLNKG